MAPMIEAEKISQGAVISFSEVGSDGGENSGQAQPLGEEPLAADVGAASTKPPNICLYAHVYASPQDPSTRPQAGRKSLHEHVSCCQCHSGGVPP